MGISARKMEQDTAPDKIPAQDLAELLAIIETSCGSKEELKRLCQDPELKKILPPDTGEMIDNPQNDLSSATYNIVDRVIESGNLRPLIQALKDFKSDVGDPLGKHTLREYLSEKRAVSAATSSRAK